ncbi:hypothetical protein U9M48_014881 [Paspalum notatum var. saurae]|uniref:Uncharacterized protein n=1 Tax=Paspalum notatum var. saurae TaxID=547442 RepID=A0AAQ3T2E0_PASNO
MLSAVLGLRLRVLRRRRPRRGRRRDRPSRGRVGGEDGGDGDDGGREPVLLVSGMGGSVLEARSRSDPKFDVRVWVRILFADRYFKKYLWGLYNADTGYVEPLDDDVEIVVPEDDYGLYAIDILDPSWFVELLKLSMVYHFHDMIDMLVNCGYEKGTTLFGYGYDFRQSNRCFIFMPLCVELVFAKYVNKWICIACPFQGAPGCINDSLLTGLQFVYGFESFFFVSRWSMHQLLVECPSIYEMLPNPEFKWKEKPVIQVWRKNPEEDGIVELIQYESSDCISLFQEALRNNELTYDGKNIALPFNMSVLEWATKTRQILDNAELPDTVSFYSIYGTSYDTPYDVWVARALLHKLIRIGTVFKEKTGQKANQLCRFVGYQCTELSYGSESSPIEDLSEVCHTVPVYTNVDGDCTVPTESAMADGFAAKERVGVEADHRGLLSDENVFELLKKWLGVSEKTQRVRVSKSKVVDLSS